MTSIELAKRQEKALPLKVFKVADDKFYVENSSGKICYRVNLCIPMNPDTDSNNLRTPIPIQSGHLFRSKADTPQLERSDAGKFVNASRNI